MYTIKEQSDLKLFLDENFPPKFLRYTILYDYNCTIYANTSEVDCIFQEILYWFVCNFNIEIKIPNQLATKYLFNLL